jgi:hypothetical protein
LSGVATFDSHGRAPYSWPHRLPSGRRLLLPKANLPIRHASGGSCVRMLKPVDPALFLSEDAVRPPRKNPWDRSRPGMSLEPTPWNFPFGLPPRVQRPCVQRLNATTPDRLSQPRFRTRSRSSFCAPGRPEIRGRQALIRCRNWPAEWSIQEPLRERRRDPNTLAPNRSKARTTPLRPSRSSASS